MPVGYLCSGAKIAVDRVFCGGSCGLPDLPLTFLLTILLESQSFVQWRASTDFFTDFFLEKSVIMSADYPPLTIPPLDRETANI